MCIFSSIILRAQLPASYAHLSASHACVPFPSAKLPLTQRKTSELTDFSQASLQISFCYNGLGFRKKKKLPQIYPLRSWEKKAAFRYKMNVKSVTIQTNKILSLVDYMFLVCIMWLVPKCEHLRATSSQILICNKVFLSPSGSVKRLEDYLLQL